MFALLLLAAAAPAVTAQPLPPPVKAIVDAAVASGDAATVATVIKLTRQTNPESAAELDTIEAAFADKRSAETKAQEAARQQALAEAGPLDGWKGNVEIGASRSTGNTDALALYGAFKLQREGLRWRHAIEGRADVQETAGARTADRRLASWQPNYKFGDRLYAYGLAQYEYDRFLGIDDRYTAGGGIGLQIAPSQTMKLDVEGGPALRFTDEMAGTSMRTLAARASVNFSWAVTPTLELRQSSSLYHEGGSSSVNALTSLDTKLIGALKARFSYNIQYESDVPLASKSLDTLSRATLVYSF